MFTIGVSLHSARNRSGVLAHYVRPIRRDMEDNGIGFWSNHLIEDPDLAHSVDVDPTVPPVRNHLIVFEVFDFKRGMDFLRRSFTERECPPSTTFINMTGAQPLY